MEKHKLKGTFLLQHDALVNQEFTDLLKAHASERLEFGLWLELCQSVIEKAGIQWRGREGWSWDPHSNIAFPVGYTLAEREKIADVLMSDFRAVFGEYPASVGSWAIDAHTLAYLYEKYHIVASCNCKEQWGTDGYTLWGGYYGGGYYPSRKNMLCPAQTDAERIGVPVFRMLGSDMIYQYDLGLDPENGARKVQNVTTLEPVYCGSDGGGGIPKWVDWFFDENYSGNCLAYAYAQAGQENSFGWESMEKGLVYQFAKIREWQNEGRLTAETLGETGRWFKAHFDHTPATVIAAFHDWKNEGRKSVWYNCENYRANVYTENDRFWIRDLYLFREGYAERYFDRLCDSPQMTFDNLPLVDGNRFSGNGVRAGVYPEVGGKPVAFKTVRYTENGESAKLTFETVDLGAFTLAFSPEKLEIRSETGAEFRFKVRAGKTEKLPEIVSLAQKRAELSYNGFEYAVSLEKGVFSETDAFEAGSEDGRITLKLI